MHCCLIRCVSVVCMRCAVLCIWLCVVVDFMLFDVDLLLCALLLNCRLYDVGLLCL